MRRCLLLTLSIMLAATVSWAAPAITCHCFQDRAYDPQRPTAADDYMLASTQNSLYAALANVPKKEVVRARMAGADGAEMWVSWHLAHYGNVEQARIEIARGRGKNWRQVIETLRIPPDRLDPAVLQGVLCGEETSRLAKQVVDAVLVSRCEVDKAELAQLRKTGADNQQTILALLLARKTGRPATTGFESVKRGLKSWSGQLAAAGITAENLEAETRGLIKDTKGKQ